MLGDRDAIRGGLGEGTQRGGGSLLGWPPAAPMTVGEEVDERRYAAALRDGLLVGLVCSEAP